MAQETKHTQGKWVIPSKPYPIVDRQVMNFKHYPRNESVFVEINIYSEEGKHICEKTISQEHLEEAEANMEFICKAVNSHRKLVDMLSELLKIHEDSTYGDVVYRLLVTEQSEKLLQSLK